MALVDSASDGGAACPLAEQKAFVSQALALIIEHPEWKRSQFYSALGISKATWFRLLQHKPILRTALDAQRANRTGRLPCGYKDREGNMDAWDEG
jgi:hypothetical protein